MTTNSELATCGVAAWASVEVPRAEVPALRKQPGEFRGGRAPALAVKLADEQTVLAMAAVLRAINAAGWQDRSFADWGVIAAPQYLARVQTAASLERFLRLGVRGMSPLTIPQTMLSAVSGSLSVALGAHGLNFGIGGAPGQLRDALLVGLSLTQATTVAGLWVVLTEWSTEPVPDGQGDTQTSPTGRAVALACLSAAQAESRHTLTLRRAALGERLPDLGDVASLAAFLAERDAVPTPLPSRRWSTDLGGGLYAELTERSACLPLPAPTTETRQRRAAA